MSIKTANGNQSISPIIKRPFSKNSLLITVLLSTLISMLNAQHFDLLAPKEIEVTDTEPTIYTNPDYYTSALEEVQPPIIKALEGLVFVNSPELIKQEGLNDKDLHFIGVPLLESPVFEELIVPYLGQPVTLTLLDEITREIILFYKESNRPVVDAIIPEQNIETGTIQILVLESKLGKVTVEGNKWFSQDLLVGHLRIKRGETLDSDKLLRDIGWLNQNPFLRVDLIYSKGENQGETDIVLKTKDRFPVRFYTGYEDNGSVITGRDRILGGINWGNAFNLGHQLSYQFTGSNDFSRMQAHSLNYSAPFKSKRTLSVFGSWAQSNGTAATADIDGTSWQISSRYSFELPEWRFIKQQLAIGFDFKRSDSTLGYNVLTLTDAVSDVDQLVAEYKGHLNDKRGFTDFGANVYLNPGGITSKNTTYDYQQFSNDINVKDSYIYARVNASRVTYLPNQFKWTSAFQAQYSSANLLPSEQLAIGGKRSIRGYEESTASGDHGFMFNQEIHLPPIKLSHNLGYKGLHDTLHLYGFFDFGVVSNNKNTDNAKNNFDLYSIGPGFRYVISPYFSLGVDYGIQLREPSYASYNHGSRAHISANVSY